MTTEPGGSGSAPRTAAGSTPAASSGPSSTLGGRAARGAGVVMAGQLVRIILQVASVTVLARLLTPVDYGLVATVLVIVGVGEIFRDFGLSTAAIQAETLSRTQQSALFWLNTAIGAVLGAMAFVVAPLVAGLLDQPALEPITRVLALTFLLNGVTTQFRADLNRRMRFGWLTLSDVSAQVLALVVAILCAANGTGYWSLVAQQLTQVGATMLLMAWAARWIPGRPRRRAGIAPMVRFGRNLMASQLVGYANNNVDTAIVAIGLGPGPLGVYSRGYQLLMSPLGQLRGPTTTVALPVLAQLRGDPDRSGRYLVRGQLALGYTLVAGLALMFGIAGPVIDLALGPRWTEVAPLFAAFAVAGAFQTLSYVGNWVYLSRGLTAQLFRYSLISLAIKVVCVAAGSFWGIQGVAIGFAIAPGLAWPLSLWWLSRLTPLPVRGLWWGAGRILSCAVLAGAACRWVIGWTSLSGDLARIGVGTATVIATYAVLALCVPRIRADLADVWHVVRSAVRR